ncbi:hypothetical protein ABIE26_001046 [Pedobacter africanus]|uniref:Uncharacterized protein n=1 Tax=Pedobacter africanus TaxID=151894 RepID=A0ACC6KTB3_9SPHI|nr:hypothetical protein [Pedobacter africanus]
MVYYLKLLHAVTYALLLILYLEVVSTIYLDSYWLKKS